MNSNLKNLAQILGMMNAPKETASDRRNRKRKSVSRPPVSMNEGTEYLYAKKPNIKYWQDKYGESVIDKSVSELQSMGI